jgi:hypothetical protein
MSSDSDGFELLTLSAPNLQALLNFVVTSNVRCIPPVKQAVLDSDKVQFLEKMYKFIYADIPFLSISRFIKQSSRASLFDEVYGSKLLSRENNIIISAYWPVNDDGFLLYIASSAPHFIM